MKEQTPPRFSTNSAFTLVEMLVVITIIGILAAVIIPVSGAAIRSSRLKMAMTEKAQVEAAIGAYKMQKGHFPPDNRIPPRPDFDPLAMNQLFYELTGTVYTNSPPPEWFISIHAAGMDGGVIKANDDGYGVKPLFGVDGFANSAQANPANRTEVQQSDARDFMPHLEQKFYNVYTTSKGNPMVLGLQIDGPLMYDKINPWRYNSSNPTNNPESYDLWIDLKVGSKTYRISNWSPEPQPLN